MRKPRDLDRYGTPEEAAAALREIADMVEKRDGLMRCQVELRFWDPEWETKAAAKLRPRKKAARKKAGK